jgi:hypothetical protein
MKKIQKSLYGTVRFTVPAAWCLTVVRIRFTEVIQTCARRFNMHVDNLQQNEVKKEFKIKLQNGYQELQRAEDQNEDIEKIWNEAKSALIKTSDKVIGYRERGRKEWMSSGAWNTVKQRREAKRKLNTAKKMQQKIEKSQVYG